MTKKRRIGTILGVGFVAALVAFGACRKKMESGTGTEAAGIGSGATAESSGGERARGWIEVKGADFIGHEVRDAETGAKVATIDSLQSVLPLAAGTYEVGFGSAFLKGVVVKGGETTILEPGGLTLNHASLRGHDVVAVDSGAVQGRVGATNSHIVLIPGTYAVKFGPLSWTVDIVAGKTTTLDPGIIKVAGADIRGHRIFDSSGVFVGDVSATGSSLALPPGNYTIELDGNSVPFALEAGQTVALERK